MQCAAGTPVLVMETLDNRFVPLVTRFLVILPFLYAGVQKLVFWRAGVNEMHLAGLNPSWLFNLAALFTELGGSLSVLLNRRIWLGAGALGIFTLLTTFIAHRFWDFYGVARIGELNSFLEHATICAAFILVTVISIRDQKRGSV
jgi:transmembrane protein